MEKETVSGYLRSRNNNFLESRAKDAIVNCEEDLNDLLDNEESRTEFVERARDWIKEQHLDLEIEQAIENVLDKARTLRDEEKQLNEK